MILTTLDISETLEHLDFFSDMLMNNDNFYDSLPPDIREDILGCVEDLNRFSHLFWISEEEQAMLDYLAVTLTREED